MPSAQSTIRNGNWPKAEGHRDCVVQSMKEPLECMNKYFFMTNMQKKLPKCNPWLTTNQISTCIEIAMLEIGRWKACDLNHGFIQQIKGKNIYDLQRRNAFSFPQSFWQHRNVWKIIAVGLHMDM